MAVSQMQPGATKTTRDSIVPESATLAYTPAELAAIAARRTGSSGGGAQYPTYQPYTIPFGGGGYPTLGGSYPNYPYQPGNFGFTGDPVPAPTDLSLPVPDWACQILTVLNTPCTWSGAISKGLAYFSGQSDPNNSTGAQSSCPDGYEVDASTGICKKSGVGGAIERWVPGGATGTLGTGGQATIGAFGRPAMVPAQVGTVQRNDGTVSPVLRCLRGMVLGMDDLCYPKGSIPRQYRKWKPACKPPMTCSDAKALRRIGTLQARVKKLASSAGLSTKKR